MLPCKRTNHTIYLWRRRHESPVKLHNIFLYNVWKPREILRKEEVKNESLEVHFNIQLSCCCCCCCCYWRSMLQLLTYTLNLIVETTDTSHINHKNVLTLSLSLFPALPKNCSSSITSLLRLFHFVWGITWEDHFRKS